jgi:hypothetical protein
MEISAAYMQTCVNAFLRTKKVDNKYEEEKEKIRGSISY